MTWKGTFTVSEQETSENDLLWTTADPDGVLEGTHFMKGDFAAAEGGLAAGCRFFGAYPITPATEVAIRMAQRLPHTNGHFIQMEDEIASMAAILGASNAGIRSMTSTSGPGFSLMLENYGLGFFTETPTVIVQIQRGGPSTGMPTLVGQSDVMQVKWGSHGDYEAIALAPANVQEMFDMTVDAFNLSELYRTPVVLLSDQVVGHSTGKLVIPPADQIKVARRRIVNPPAEGEERRKPFDSSYGMVPPMINAGDGHKLHTTGLTHDERGYPALFSEAHDKLMKRLIGKIRDSGLSDVEELWMDDAEYVVLSYGSMSTSAIEAVEALRNEGHKIGVLRPRILWPEPREVLLHTAARPNVKRIIVAEINYGQYEKVVRDVVDKPVDSLIFVPGRLPAPELVYQEIKNVVTGVGQ